MLQKLSDGVLDLVKKSKDNDIEDDDIIFIMFSMGNSTKSGQFLMATNDLQLLSPKNKQNKQKILSFIDGSGGGKPGRLQGKANNFKGFQQLFQFINTLYPTNDNNNNNQSEAKPKLDMNKPKDALKGLNQLIDILE